MEELQKVFERMMKNVPLMALEAILKGKLKAAKLSVSKAALRKAAEHILSGAEGDYVFDGTKETDGSIDINEEDLSAVLAKVEYFYDHQLPGVIEEAASKSADMLYDTLTENWPEEAELQFADMTGFRERLEHRYSVGMGKLRMLLTAAREWGNAVNQRKVRASGGKLKHLDDVLLRLHMRACQVTMEIICLLETGFADGAMARWRTLHEITTVATFIADKGEEAAEWYVYYQIVESKRALDAYEKSHEALGFKPFTKTTAAKVNRDFAKVLKKYGKDFGEEYGWAYKFFPKGRVNFARIEEVAGVPEMRSPYKMASYNVHASPKGIFFKLGAMQDPSAMMGGASNAGLIEPAQHTAVSLGKISSLLPGDAAPWQFDDIVTGKIMNRLVWEIPRDFHKADRRLRRDDKRYRGTQSKK